MSSKTKAVSYVLSGLSMAGTLAVGILSAVATPKAMEAIKQDYRENGIPGQYGFWDKVKACWKCYIPAASVALGTIGCEIGVGIANAKVQRSLTGAYTLLDKGFRTYRQQIRETVGKEVDEKAMAEQREEEIKEAFRQKHGMEDELFCDTYSNRYFHRTMSEVYQAELELNKQFAILGHASLNDFYDFLNLKRTDLGEALGWSEVMGDNFYGYNWIDVEHELTRTDDGLECYILHFPLPPTDDYLEGMS